MRAPEDPAVELVQTWTVTPGLVRHSLQLNTSLAALDVEIVVRIAADFTDMAAIRLSRFRDPTSLFGAEDSTLRWREGGKTVTAAATGSSTTEGGFSWRGTARRGSVFAAE
ncbi:glycogen debranching N-terminal domain-containing protein [Arthrobacter oryzae]|uniref:glycogen debranching N-terminal domain-containing protein n=1 Tax=Arthrobacter oryzae TaxID=409290 RepID=UPI0011CDEBBF|nr:glycogen debranching N-terminal domain-containing protein [Arthrobacter oryzae]